MFISLQLSPNTHQVMPTLPNLVSRFPSRYTHLVKIALTFLWTCSFLPQIHGRSVLFCFVSPPLLSGCRWKRGGNRQWWKGWLEIRLLNRLSFILAWISICHPLSFRLAHSWWGKFRPMCSLMCWIWNHFTCQKKRARTPPALCPSLLTPC